MIEQARLYQIYILLIIGFVNGRAQEVYYEQYTDSDGLPSMTTYNIVQDSTGILWVGTENGLVSYDGEKFENYTHSDLTDNDMISVIIGADGCPLFLNLSNQLGMVKDKKIVKLYDFNKNYNYKIFSSRSKNYCHKILSYKDSVVYNVVSFKEQDSTAFQNVAKFKILRNRDESKSKSVVWNNPQYSMYYGLENNEAVLYIDSLQDQMVSKNQIKFKKFRSTNLEGYQSIQHAKINEDHYCLTSTYQCIRVDSSFVNRYSISDNKNLVVVDNLHFIFNSDSLTVFDSNTGLSKVLIKGVIVNTVFMDREKSLWISTRKSGLLKIPNYFLRTMSIKEESQDISKILPFEDGIIIFWNDRFRVFSKEMNQLFYKNFGTNEKSTGVILNGEIIVISDNEYLVSKNGNLVFNQYELNEEVDNFATSIKDIALFKDHLTVATNDRVRFANKTNGSYQYDLNKTILNIGRLYEIEYLPQHDKLFAGTSKGLFTIDETFSANQYVEELKNQSISSILEAHDSSIWVGTQNNGLYRIKDDVVVDKFTEASGDLLSNTINSIALRDSFIYAATTKGVTRINTHTTTAISKNKSDGLPSDYITELCVFNEKIWLGIGKNIVMVDDIFFQTKNIPPKLSLSQVYKNYQPIDFVNGMKFNHDENKIDIVLNNISLNSGNNKSIKYRIQNLDTTWIQINESTLRLPALDEGKYQLEIVGIDASGIESKPKYLFFEIMPPWWNTYWAWFIWIGSGLGIITLIFNYRIRQEVQKRSYLTQINEIKDQALQLQMNPHFIFNSLNAIQGFIGTDDEELAMNYLARFARLIRLIFEHSKGSTISLEEELEFIRLYLNLEKLRFKDKVNIEITVDPEVENTKDMINVPPLLIQPIVENSFKHGLFHKKGIGHLSIDYSMNQDFLQVTIEDDGIGRIESGKLKERNSEKHVSSGIKTTIERIKLLNFGKSKNLNTVEIEDLYNEDGKATGTKTILNLSI